MSDSNQNRYQKPKTSYNWLYILLGIILAILAVTVYPIWTYRGIYRIPAGIVPSAISLIPPLGVLLGLAVSWFFKIAFNTSILMGGLIATFLTCLIIGPLDTTPLGLIILEYLYTFLMFSIPAWAMWGAVTFFRASKQN